MNGKSSSHISCSKFWDLWNHFIALYDEEAESPTAIITLHFYCMVKMAINCFILLSRSIIYLIKPHMHKLNVIKLDVIYCYINIYLLSAINVSFFASWKNVHVFLHQNRMAMDYIWPVCCMFLVTFQNERWCCALFMHDVFLYLLL